MYQRLPSQILDAHHVSFLCRGRYIRWTFITVIDIEVDFIIAITMAVWVRTPFGEKCPNDFLIRIYVM